MKTESDHISYDLNSDEVNQMLKFHSQFNPLMSYPNRISDKGYLLESTDSPMLFQFNEVNHHIIGKRGIYHREKLLNYLRTNKYDCQICLSFDMKLEDINVVGKKLTLLTKNHSKIDKKIIYT